jgi:hypothetical protein
MNFVCRKLKIWSKDLKGVAYYCDLAPDQEYAAGQNEYGFLLENGFPRFKISDRVGRSFERQPSTFVIHIEV